MKGGLDYPVALKLKGRPVLVVGAGPVAQGRIEALLDAEARVHVIAPLVNDAIRGLAEGGRITLSEREYMHGDCAGAVLVLTAVNVPAVSQAIVAEARARGQLVNAADIPDLCDFNLPSVGREGPITVAVSTSGTAPSLAAALRRHLMARVRPEYAELARTLGRLRERIPGGPARRKLFDGLLARRAPALQEHRARRALTLPARPRSRGMVHIVGAGPGDAGLLTVKAAELLERADVVVHDRLVHPDVLAMVHRGARLIYVGKEGGGEQVPQEAINEILVAQAQLGRDVVRLKGGDPFVFGRGSEEALALAAARIPFELVPGISSGLAAPAYAGIPLTHRGVSRSVTFATGHSIHADPDFARLARADTLVLFMSGHKLEATARALVDAGRSAATPAAMVEAGTWREQRVVSGTLADIAARAAKAEVGSPALFVVGEVVSLREQLGHWFQPDAASHLAASVAS